MTARILPFPDFAALINHPQWKIIAGALDRYNAGERDPDYTLGIIDYGFRLLVQAKAGLCEDCPPVGYPTDKTRCETCPRRECPKVQELRRHCKLWLERDRGGEHVSST